jgi:hypothetical protein
MELSMKYAAISIFCLQLSLPVWGIDEMTVYELLAPDTHQFAIQYDFAATEPGSKLFFNIIRPGSEATNEKVVDRATGEELKFALTTAKEAKANGQGDADVADDTKYIKVLLLHPVPKDGEYRLRIFKTYRDAKSYFQDAGTIVFERSLGVNRNVILLPKGYELISSSVPVIVSTESGNRVKISMVNDRQDELAVRIVARKLPDVKER